MTEIIVGMDESPGAAQALRWAVRESNLRGRPVRAVHAWSTHDHPDDPTGNGFDAAVHEAVEKAIDAAVDHALGDDASEHVAVEVVHDHPARALLERADGAALLVVGARSRGGFAGLHLGSVADHCLHHARGPLAVVRGEEDRWPDGRIVVGVDGSPASQRALHWALAEARLRACPVEVLHAWQIHAVGGMYAVALEPAVAEAAARGIVREALAAEDTSGVALEVDVVGGDPTGRLLHAADTAGLVVVGSRGHGPVGRFFLGSVGLHLAHHSPCPVVVLPADDH